jgi:hypothetical protein
MNMGSMQQNRKTQAAVMTAVAGVIVLGIGATLGPMAVVLSVITMPIPLLLLWLSSDVFRADEAAEAARLSTRPVGKKAVARTADSTA